MVLAAYQALATKRPYAEGLLIPGTKMRYRFALSSLPATIQGQVDVGTWLVMDVVFAAQAIMALFHVNLGAVADNAVVLGCLGDAVEAANLGSRPGVDAVTALARAALSCTDRFKVAISGTVKPVQSTPSAACVRYARERHPLGFSVELATGRVLAINTAVGDQPLHTQIGNIRVDSSLSELRTAFADHQIEEHFNYDFGQGSNGVIVNGPGGTIAGHAPTNAEDSC